MNKYKGFTLAEVLVTLTIIGVIAAILFPSILANYNTRTLKAKRQALVARMSQAMGGLADQFRNYEDISCGDINDLSTCEDNGSAIKFIAKGLSNAYKIAAVCDSDTLAACDFPSSIALADGTTFSFENSDKFSNYNQQVLVDESALQIDTKSAAFMTKNGESILLFFNPRCGAKAFDAGGSYYTETKVCVNMVYDLNGGKKKPNRMNEDIGFISVFYSDAPYVTAPNIVNPDDLPDYGTTTNATGTEVTFPQQYNFSEAKKVCSSIADNVGLPTVEEAMSMQLNAPIIRDLTKQVSQNYAWTVSPCNPEQPFLAILQNYNATPVSMDGKALYVYCGDYKTDGYKDKNERSDGTKYIARCVYKD